MERVAGCVKYYDVAVIGVNDDGLIFLTPAGLTVFIILSKGLKNW